jgi:hypothetical protein
MFEYVGCVFERIERELHEPFIVWALIKTFKQKKSIDPRTPPVVPIALNLPAVAFGGAALFDAERGLAGQAVLLGSFLAGFDALWRF